MSVAGGSWQHFAPSGEANNLDPQCGFLVDFAVQGGCAAIRRIRPGRRAANRNPSPADRARRTSRICVAKDRRADRKLGMRRLDGDVVDITA